MQFFELTFILDLIKWSDGKGIQEYLKHIFELRVKDYIKERPSQQSQVYRGRQGT